MNQASGRGSTLLSLVALVLIGSPALARGEILLRAVQGRPATLVTEGTSLAADAPLRQGRHGRVERVAEGIRYTPESRFVGVDRFEVGDAEVRVVISEPLDLAAARAAILKDVKQVHGGNQPGYAVAYGPTCGVIAEYGDGDARGAAVVAARWGKGRVVALPDHQILNFGSHAETADSGRFYANLLTWAAAGRAPRHVVVTGANTAADWLREQKVPVVREIGRDLRYADALKRADVLVGWVGTNPSEADREVIADFVRRGGGLVLCEYGVGYEWWWKRPIHQAPGNLLLREVGLGFTGGNRWENAAVTLKPATRHTTPDDLLTLLTAAPGTKLDIDSNDAARLLGGLGDALPPDDPLQARIAARLRQRTERILPTPQTPVRDALERMLIRRESDELLRLPVDEVTAHRAAEGIYGAIPADAPRIARDVTIDPAVSHWHSTGLYAVPGEIVTVTVPPEIAERGYRVRISGHTDNIANLDVWRRPPRVARDFPVDAETVRVASPFGGALYFDVGGKPPGGEPFTVRFAGAIAAPFFRLGVDTNADWVTQRDNPAPQAELCSPHVCLSVPADAFRHIDDMEALMAFWDQVVQFHDEVGGQGHLRTRADRINIDVQISAGAAHAGYPTQGPALWNMNDLAALRREGSWGWFHELGHEAQRRPDHRWGYDNPYTFDGAIEATVNIFSTHARDRFGITDPEGWGWTSYPFEVMRRATQATKDGSFASVGVGEKLAMYLQLRDGFGWGAWQNVLTSYNRDQDENAGALPKDVQQERDQFLVRFSEEVGHDLTGFLRGQWKLGVSEEAIAKVKHLPPWMPAVGTLDRVELTPGETRTLDLQAEMLGMDGIARLGAVSQPEHASLERQDDGTWLLTPTAGYVGTDAFQYEVVSSSGHTWTQDVAVAVLDAGVHVEQWRDVPGETVASLTDTPRFPDEPDTRFVRPDFTVPGNVGENLGHRVRTWLAIDQSGDYRFWITSDDGSELWLSGNEDPQAAKKIAAVQGWTAPQAWDQQPGQASEAVTLEAGKLYYLAALHKEGRGGDHLSVAWSGPGFDRQILSGPVLRLAPEFPARAVEARTASGLGSASTGEATPPSALAVAAEPVAGTGSVAFVPLLGLLGGVMALTLLATGGIWWATVATRRAQAATETPAGLSGRRPHVRPLPHAPRNR